MYILTGGSSIRNAKWSACDIPIRNGSNRLAPIQMDIERKFGLYLLARGVVNGVFTSALLGDILIIQSRRYWNDDPQPHILAASLIKTLPQYPDEQFTIHTHFPKETCESIRRRIGIQLESKCPNAIGQIDFRFL